MNSDEALALLAEGELSLLGQFQWGSNYTFFGQIQHGDQTVNVVYKPTRGERPLWDFPRGTLARRETAAYLTSTYLGWDLVPPTVLRRGPHGIGSVQLYVDVDPNAHYFTFHEDAAYLPALQRLVLFDLVTNNADRKAGHCLAAGNGRIIAIDHGLCFHSEPKLRTVVWSLADEPIPADLRSDVKRLGEELARPDSHFGQALVPLLRADELTAMAARAAEVAMIDRYPQPPQDRRAFPWPLV